MPVNPFADTNMGDQEDQDDRALVARARDGDRQALEQLVSRHQRWIYNIVLRMVYLPQDAEDATQEVLIKIITHLAAFEGRSRFRTWLYRLVVNHVLNMKRGRVEAMAWTFDSYGRGLNEAPDNEPADLQSIPADLQLLIDEARIGCTSGMLLCLDREQRLVYVLGEIFGVPDVVGAELMGLSRANFRQKLARARRDLHQFMQHQCGLIKTTNPCRCARKTKAFIAAGYIDPQRLVFATSHVERVREVAPAVHEDVEALDRAYAAIHRDHPFQPSPDYVAAIRDLIAQSPLVSSACESRRSK
jgi:RNA polymerase sigma factor (sigma-70 family)